ncbi:MAG: CBS domain-containing protein [Bacteroidota bacterium]
MKVEQLMTRDVDCARPEDTLADAAMIMWRRDCGIVPVVDRTGGRFLGVLTDRDICMATATKHCAPDALPVGDVMSRRALTCRSSDDIRVAMHRMAEGQVRRVPVVDAAGHLEGIVTVNDLTLAAERNAQRGDDVVSYPEAMGVLRAISRHRHAAKVPALT